MLSITSLKIKSPFAAANGTPYLQASVGLICVATIDYFCDDPHTATDFYFELAKQSQTTFIYKSHLETTLTQKFSGNNATALQPILPKGSHFGGVVHNSLGSNNYRLTHTFIVNPFPTIDGEIPNEYLSAETLKYVFKIEIRNSFNPNIVRSVSFDSNKGQVGFLDELYNGFTPIYTLVSQTANDSFSEMIFAISSTIAISASTKVIVCAIKQVENYDISKTIIENYGLIQAELLVNDTITSSAGFAKLQATATSSTSFNLKITLTSPNPFLDQPFFIWAIVGNQVANEIDVINNAVQLKYFASNTKPAPSCGAKLTEFGTSGYIGFAFNYHDNLALPYSQIKASLQDEILANFKLSILVGYTLKSLQIAIKNNTQIVEQRTFTGSVVENKGYFLETNSLFNKVDIDFATLNFSYPFKIRYEDNLANITNNGTQNWASYSANPLYFSVIPTITDGVNDYSYDLRSQAFLINDYDIDSNTAGVDNVVDDFIIETFDLATNDNLLGNFSQTKTKVVVTCNANPLNSLGYLQTDLLGILSIQDLNSGSVFSIREMSSLRGRENDTPFLPFNPAPDRLQVLSYNPNQIVWQAVIDSEKITDNSCLTFRLDRIRLTNTITPASDPCCFSYVSDQWIDLCEPDPATNPTLCKPINTFVTSYYNPTEKRTYMVYNDGICGTFEVACCSDACMSVVTDKWTDLCTEVIVGTTPSLGGVTGCLDQFAPNYNPNATISGTCINFVQSCAFIKFANGETVYNGFQDTTGIRSYATTFSEKEVSLGRLGYGPLNEIVTVLGVDQISWKVATSFGVVPLATPIIGNYITNLANESKFVEVTIPRVNGRQATALSYIQTNNNSTRANFVSARVWVESFDPILGFKISWMTYNLSTSGLQSFDTVSQEGTSKITIRKNGTIVLDQILPNTYGFSLSQFVWFNDTTAGVYDLRVEFIVKIYLTDVTFYNNSNFIIS